MGELLDRASENVAAVDGLQDVADLDASSCSRAIRGYCSYADLMRSITNELLGRKQSAVSLRHPLLRSGGPAQNEPRWRGAHVVASAD